MCQIKTSSVCRANGGIWTVPLPGLVRLVQFLKVSLLLPVALPSALEVFCAAIFAQPYRHSRETYSYSRGHHSQSSSRVVQPWADFDVGKGAFRTKLRSGAGFQFTSQYFGWAFLARSNVGWNHPLAGFWMMLFSPLWCSGGIGLHWIASQEWWECFLGANLISV